MQHREFCNVPSKGAILTEKVHNYVFYLEGYCEPMSKGELVGHFSLVGKHLAIGGNERIFPLILVLRGISNKYN